MVTSPSDNAAAIALNRFGLGARPDDTPPADPKAWLLAQFEQYQPLPAAWTGQPTAVALATQLGEQRQQTAGANPNANVNVNANANADPAASQAASQAARLAASKAIRGEIRDIYRTAVDARVNSALTSSTPFVDRLVHFWANHFAVSTEKPQVAALAGAFEVEAIRPHVLGRFDDMLVAVERHPAMQIFLDQTRSVGPDSMAALRAEQRNPDNKRGLNENLAREIMELHTLGVRSGYTQADVTEFARALTGWSVAGARFANHHGPPLRSAGRRTGAGDPARFRDVAGHCAAHRRQAGASLCFG